MRDLCNDSVEVREGPEGEDLHALYKSRLHESVGGARRGQEGSREEQGGWRELREGERIWKGLLEEQMSKCGEEDW